MFRQVEHNAIINQCVVTGLINARRLIFHVLCTTGIIHCEHFILDFEILIIPKL